MRVGSLCGSRGAPRWRTWQKRQCGSLTAHRDLRAGAISSLLRPSHAAVTPAVEHPNPIHQFLHPLPDDRPTGRKRDFFIVGYEGNRRRTAQPEQYLVLDRGERSGNVRGSSAGVLSNLARWAVEGIRTLRGPFVYPAGRMITGCHLRHKPWITRAASDLAYFCEGASFFTRNR